MNDKINKILQNWSLICEDSKGDIVDIAFDLKELSEENGIPAALKKLILRCIDMAGDIVAGDVEFNSGYKKLSQALSEVRENVEKFDNNIERDEEQSAVNERNDDDVKDEVPPDIVDLLINFGSSQDDVLEEFETNVLAVEDGNTDAIGNIKRILHTWKGEFGILGLSSYANFIHEVEDLVEKGLFSPDTFLRLSDLIKDKCTHFANGEVVSLSKEEKNIILSTETITSDLSPVSHEPTTDTDNNVNNNGSESSDTSSNNNSYISTVDPSLLSDFISEAREHLENMEHLLMNLDNEPTDLEALNGIFRSCHTIKGVAGFLNLKDIQTLSHSMENLMDMARAGKIMLNSAISDVLFESLDCLRDMIDAIEKSTPGTPISRPDNYSSLIEKLAEPEIISENNENNKKVGEILLDEGAVTQKQLDHALKKQRKGDNRKIGEILVDDENGVSPGAVVKAVITQKKMPNKKVSDESIRVQVRKLDILIDAIGEAVIAQSMIAANKNITESSDPKLRQQLAQLNSSMNLIQELSMSLRMVSLKSTFQKMARLVRDVAKKTGKKIEFFTEGEDTELDKTVVEHIGDPFIHMIRNSVDHGIEPPEGRIACGKPEKGTVTLRAFYKGGNVIIEIEDDGKGLDKDLILKKAIEKGIAVEGDKYTDSEIYNFIFTPGLSTSKKVTDVSGRGVGMDVVKRNLESLGGSVNIHSQKGVGTVFEIRLPLTLAIINGMVIRLGKERYIIPTLSIISSFIVQADQVETVLGKGEMVDVRGELIPFVKLSEIFGIDQDCNTGIAIVVENMAENKMVIFADEILNQQQIVIKSIGPSLKNIKGISGGAIMSDGSVSLIIDIAGIFELVSLKSKK